MGNQKEMARQIAEERQALRMRLRAMTHRAMKGGSGNQQSSDRHPRDVFEQTQQDLLTKQEMRAYELLAARAKMLDRALDSLRRGTYGLCQNCGAEIPWRRLQAVPGAVLCFSCKEGSERVRGNGSVPEAGRPRHQ